MKVTKILLELGREKFGEGYFPWSVTSAFGAYGVPDV